MKLSVIAIALVAGCYEPEVSDCVVTCSRPDDCAGGQTCGTDGYCGAPEVAGHCRERMVAIEIHIEGDGRVSLDTAGICDSRTAPEHTCRFTVPAELERQLQALPSGKHTFETWTAACAGATVVCALTPIMQVTVVGARFE